VSGSNPLGRAPGQSSVAVLYSIVLRICKRVHPPRTTRGSAFSASRRESAPLVQPAARRPWRVHRVNVRPCSANCWTSPVRSQKKLKVGSTPLFLTPPPQLRTTFSHRGHVATIPVLPAPLQIARYSSSSSLHGRFQNPTGIFIAPCMHEVSACTALWRARRASPGRSFFGVQVRSGTGRLEAWGSGPSAIDPLRQQPRKAGHPYASKHTFDRRVFQAVVDDSSLDKCQRLSSMRTTTPVGLSSLKMGVQAIDLPAPCASRSMSSNLALHTSPSARILERSGPSQRPVPKAIRPTWAATADQDVARPIASLSRTTCCETPQLVPDPPPSRVHGHRRTCGVPRSPRASFANPSLSRLKSSTSTPPLASEGRHPRRSSSSSSVKCQGTRKRFCPPTARRFLPSRTRFERFVASSPHTAHPLGARRLERPAQTPRRLLA